MKDIVPALCDIMTDKEAVNLNPVVLAYIGDAVESLAVRSYLVSISTAKAHKLHILSSGVVNARAQARRAEMLMPLFTESEAEVFRRARNSKPKTIAKNADIMQYKDATGLEAVFGYLYLTGNHARLSELLEYTINELKELK